MTDPIAFESATARFDLPLLYSGQAQKEIFVNEAILRIDSLLHCGIVSEAEAPPSGVEDGQIWLVATGATGEWATHDGELACRIEGQWSFVIPGEGMRVFDLSTQAEMLFASAEWKKNFGSPGTYRG
ncbi:DUF2793 domain-containing protein [Novosphingobium colocasiae]|uniref:DUF2793 domain-containing protein n=1 Tax=Novosphingobium colocasiae TaxID=1256513 RepID=UPI0035B30E0E